MGKPSRLFEPCFRKTDKKGRDYDENKVGIKTDPIVRNHIGNSLSESASVYEKRGLCGGRRVAGRLRAASDICAGSGDDFGSDLCFRGNVCSSRNGDFSRT